MDLSAKNIFPGQKPDEKIILFARRHWISFLPNLLISIFMILFPIAVMIAIIIGFKIDVNPSIINYIILGVSAFILFVMTFFVVGWIDYYFDVLIVTDERLVNIEQNGLFNRHISELDLLRVQNVSTSVKGVFQTMFDYGSLVVETAGDSLSSGPNSRYSDFTMDAVPNPNDLAQTILHLHQSLVSTRGQAHALTHGEGEIHPNPGYPTPTPSALVASNLQQPEKEMSHPAPSESTGPDENSTNVAAYAVGTNDVMSPSPLREVADEGQLKEGEIIDL